ncbi:MAG: F0F1 ATP synthase subunit delta [Sulfuricurvum sp.]
MKHEMIAKRYVKSLVSLLDAVSLDNASDLFTVLATAFEEPKFLQIMHSDDIATSAKTDLILGMVESLKSDEMVNFIKLLGENGRLLLIPAIAHELKRQIGAMKRVYNGRIYSVSTIDQGAIDSIAQDLGSKMGASIALTFVESACDGVRVVVDGLNVEIDFSKSRLNAQMTEHILKSI